MKLKLSLFLLIVFLVSTTSLLPFVPSQAQPSTWVQKERGRDYVIYFNSTQPWQYRAEFGVPEWVLAPNGSYVPFIFHDKTTTEGYYEIANGLVGCRIYPYFAVLLNPELNETRVYMEQWSIERYAPAPKKWSSVITPSPSLSPTTASIVTNSSGVFLTQSYSNWGGQLNLTYALREGRSLKHFITFKSAVAGSTQFRMVMSWSGIVGSKVQCDAGSYAIEASTPLTSTRYQFQKADGSLSVFEDLTSSTQFNQPCVVDTHAQGMKATFAFQNGTSWTVEQDGVIQLDPDTHTFQPSTADTYLDGANPNTARGSLTTMLVGMSGTGAPPPYRPVINFDMSGVIPAGSTINSATLRLYCASCLSGTEGFEEGAFRLTQTGWTEGGATWNKYDGSNPWETAGGDYTETDGAYANIPVSPPDWVIWTVTAQVQYAVNNVGRVAHFLVKQTIENNPVQLRATFWSREYTTDTSLCPKLYVDYTSTITITLATSPSGCNIRLDSGTWYTSPHQYTGITPGSSHSIEAQDPYTVAANQQQYVWVSWSDSGANPHNVAPSVDTTYTATMQQQWYIIITSSGISTDSTGTVATLGGDSKTQAELPYSKWFNNGGSCSYSFSSPVSTTDSDKRYVWSSTSGLDQTLQSNSFTVSTYGTITGTYSIQWQVTITSSGISTDSSGTVATLDGDAKTQVQLPYSKWLANDYSLAYSFSSPVSTSDSNKRYTWSSTSGLSQTLQSNTFSVTAGGTITGSYTIQWQVTITSSGIGADSSGTVATLDGDAKTQAELPYSKWLADGYSLAYAFSSPVTGVDQQYVWASTSGLAQTLQSNTFSVTVGGTITGTYTITVSYHLIAFTSSFRANDGSALYVNPSAFSLILPNDTVASNLSPALSYLIANGTTELISVTWEGRNVIPSIHPTFDAADGSPTFNLRIYTLSCQAVDQSALKVNGVTYKITYSNGTCKSYTSDATGYRLISNQVGNGTLTFTLWWRDLVVVDSWDYALGSAQDPVTVNTYIYRQADNILRFALNETAISSHSYTATNNRLTFIATATGTRVFKLETATFGKPYYVMIGSTLYLEGTVWAYDGASEILTIDLPFSSTITTIVSWSPYSQPSPGDGGGGSTPFLPHLPTNIVYIATGGQGSWLLGFAILSGLFSLSIIAYRFDRRIISGLLIGASIVWVIDLVFVMGVLPSTLLDTTLAGLLPQPLSTYLVTPPPLALPTLTYTLAEWIQMAVMFLITLGFAASIALYLWEAE